MKDDESDGIPPNHPQPSRLFMSAPTDAEWQSQLAGQTHIAVSARQALEAVRAADWRADVTSINDEQAMTPRKRS
ncbi:hypothetical protein [Mycolicibacterium sp.]|uniref:hypothetical protein n=1 Tax=Mycolicibacterium sp. TaxID=2320850 RepID=UPI001A33205B|nr:hypothetical protein [Mycolicibacterium sp.]MBJ7339210.1 hypothetical protein [Mycolicibacterium sp.]